MEMGSSRTLGVRLLILVSVFLAATLVSAAGTAPGAAPDSPDSPTEQLSPPPATEKEKPALVPATPTYVGSDTCRSCHRKVFQGWEKNPHHKIENMANHSLARGCESCHGPGSIHVEAGGGAEGIVNPRTAPNHQVNNLCLKCHERDTLIEARSSLHLNEELSCLSCHGVHGNENHKLLVKKETELCKDCHGKEAMETNLFARHPIREGQMTCTSCHNPHNSREKMLVKQSVNQLCRKCHGNHSGPFIYDHPPVVENCLTCHKPHGSQTRGMLQTRVPLLCFQCHGNTQASHDQSVATRQRCLDCHSEIHGSRRDKWFFNNREK